MRPGLAAFDAYRETSLEQRAHFLETIAAQIEALGDALIDRAVAETGLPKARIQGERGRTCTQLRTFARVVRAGEWLDVRIDQALPERQPLPRCASARWPWGRWPCSAPATSVGLLGGRR